ncbi:ABC transporter ATP-binding protein [Planctomycetota bacterium]
MIRLSGISKIYPGGQRTMSALEPTNLSVNAGEFVVIVGRSGSGKSTLLGIAGGLLRPTAGDVILNDQSLWTLDEKKLAQFRAQQIGFVFQNASVVQSLILLENVMLANLFTDSQDKTAERRARLLLADVGLGDRAHAYPDQISGGEKRRIAVASALMNTPPLLLADEPTGELDSETENQIMALLQQANGQGTTVLLVTHNRDLTHYAHRVCTMEQGRLIEQGVGP